MYRLDDYYLFSRKIWRSAFAILFFCFHFSCLQSYTFKKIFVPATKTIKLNQYPFLKINENLTCCLISPLYRNILKAFGYENRKEVL